MNIYTKLREAVERSVLGGTIEVVSEGTNSTVSYNNKTISPYLLLAELKKLEESVESFSECCGSPIVKCADAEKIAEEGFYDACGNCLEKHLPPLTKEEVDKQNQKANSEVYQPIVTLTRGFPKDFTPLPPLTKEEKGEEWWIDYLNERGLILRDKNGIAKHSDVEGFVAEARKKALEEVREMISIYARQAVNGHEAVAFDALKAWIDERFNEK